MPEEFTFSFETDGDPGDGVEGLLARNAAWVDALPDGYFAHVQTAQDPSVVTMSCSDSRVAQEAMFVAFDEPGQLFTPSSIGNSVQREVNGEAHVDGSFLYPIAALDAEIAAVVGHTGCGAVTAALDSVREESPDLPASIAADVERLVPTVERGIEAGLLDDDPDDALAVNRLVEFNVHEQVRFLGEHESVPDDVTCVGFVYDFQGVYDGPRGRSVLVAVDGERDPTALRAAAGPYGEWVGTLLDPDVAL